MSKALAGEAFQRMWKRQPESWNMRETGRKGLEMDVRESSGLGRSYKTGATFSEGAEGEPGLGGEQKIDPWDLHA